jgi:hypothetical protein
MKPLEHPGYTTRCDHTFRVSQPLFRARHNVLEGTPLHGRAGNGFSLGWRLANTDITEALERFFRTQTGS